MKFWPWKNKPSQSFPSDLALVQTDDLVNELSNRYDAMILNGVKFTNNSGEFITIRLWSGNRYSCLGLLSQMTYFVNSELSGNEVHIKTEDR